MAPKYPYFNLTFPAQHVAHVEIERPNKLNAFCTPMWHGMRDIFEKVSIDPEVRCVVLSGAGERAFTAGLDIQQASESQNSTLASSFIDPGRKAAHIRRHLLEYQDHVSSFARCEKLVIALLHGHTYGLGINLASACDIQLCSENTKFCVKQADIGIAADLGTLNRLPEVVGGVTSWVKEVCFSARPFSAEEAKENNLVSKVVKRGEQELIKKGIKLTSYIISKSPVEVQGSKNILDTAWSRTIEDNLNYTAVWSMAMHQCTDKQTAMLSGLQKKTPTFKKL